MSNNYQNAINILNKKDFIEDYKHLYGNEFYNEALSRTKIAIEKHEELFSSNNPIYVVSAPGRIEIGGNHTDHNNGLVLAAAINKDAIAIVSKSDNNYCSVYSFGYSMIKINIEDLSINHSDSGTEALLRGMLYKFKSMNKNIGGFNCVINSNVLSGSGLSSSAAIEVLLSSIIDVLFNDANLSPIEKAKIGKYVENVYFGKPSGLLDQTASALGGLAYIDFDHDNIEVKKLDFNFNDFNYNIAVIDTKSSHDDLTDAYASIPMEMKSIAEFFGKKVLRDVNQNDFIKAIPELQKKFGERPILRSIHFFEENKRVNIEYEALKNKDIETFLNNIILSGNSSFMYLQNIYPNYKNQPMSLALALADLNLNKQGAFRVHGGGFAGTIICFVPSEKYAEFKASMEDVFGSGSCMKLNIRPQGSYYYKL